MVKILLWISMVAAGSRAMAQQDTTSYPQWMRHAIVYGIKPGSFAEHANYDHITARLGELKELGINTLWLQPVYRTLAGGQGYDVTDFFSIRQDLGDSGQLKTLVRSAHAHGMRVLFDFVPNHTSIGHPYALDVIKNGTASYYYDFYQHENDGAPYSSFYHTDSTGFVSYFWKNLVNLNYHNPQVRQMIIDACLFWVKTYDIDGYRFDAVWAVNARAPEFCRELRKALRAVKPDVLMLAEDRGSIEETYAKGFDAAYDWTPDTAWVSHWSWQYKHNSANNLTIFDYPDPAKRPAMLGEAIFSNEKNNFRVLRFMENNDLPRFIYWHSPAQTKMAAAILFSLPGIPLLFCGQEIGFKGHPYSRKTIFDAGKSLHAQDSLGLLSFYRQLIAQRLAHQALTSSNIHNIPLNSSGMIAYERVQGNDRVIVVANLDSVGAQLRAPALNSMKYKEFHELLSGKRIRKKSLEGLNMPGFGVLWLTPVKRK